MSEFYDRSAAALPYDMWFNGNMKLQVENGTFEECRKENLKLLENGKIEKEKYDEWCKVWDKMPMEDKISRFQDLEEETTPRPFKLPNGKTVMVSEPSDNGYSRRHKKNAKKQSLKSKRPPGSIDFSKSKLSQMAQEKQASGSVTIAPTPQTAPEGAVPVPAMV